MVLVEPFGWDVTCYHGLADGPIVDAESAKGKVEDDHSDDREG